MSMPTAGVEVSGEAAGVEACGATQVEVAAAADGADETFDDPQFPLVREGFAGEQPKERTRQRGS